MKKTSFSIAAVAALLIAGTVAGSAAELPTYQAAGLPISPLQVAVLGAAGVAEQSPAIMTVSPAQLSVLAPRHKVKTAAAGTDVTTH